MKTIATVTKLNASEKNKEISGLIERLHQEEMPKTIMKDQNITVEPAPLQLTAYRLEAGMMVLGGGNKVRVEDNRDLDRQVQAPLLQPLSLERWAIFYGRHDQRAFESFSETLQQSMETFRQQCQPPRVVCVQGTRFEEWSRELDQLLNPSVNLVICILPGQKNSAPLYS